MQENSCSQSKKCSRCEVDKPFTEFHKKKERKDGLTSECKACQSKWQKEFYSDPINKQKRIDRQSTKEAKIRAREYDLKSKYGITSADYEEMLKSQDSKCKTCGTNVPGGRSTKYFHVDHCHDSGKIRGLLCSSCNKALGLLKESISTLENLIKYIEDNK